MKIKELIFITKEIMFDKKRMYRLCKVQSIINKNIRKIYLYNTCLQKKMCETLKG